MIRPEHNETPDQDPRSPNDSQDRPRSAERRAATPNGADSQNVRSVALRVDHALRSGVDRVRPAAHRAGEWARPHAERVWSLVAPLIQRLWLFLAPYARRAGQWLSPHARKAQRSLQELQTKIAPRTAQSGRVRPSRLRAMQAGAVAAVIGVLGIVVGNLGTGGSDQAVHNAASTQSSGQSANTSSGSDQSTSGSEPKSSDDVNQDVAAAPSGPPAEGIDVSNHNGNVDWNQVAGAGKKFSYVLASDGDKFTNSQYQQQSQGAKDAGLLAGAYHYGRPTGDPNGQADHLLQTANYTNDGKTLPPVLDLEVNTKGDKCYGKSPQELADWTKQFTDHVKQTTGRDAVIYASTSYWSNCMGDSKQFNKNPLWLASYGVSDPKLPGGWDKYTFWQHDSSGTVPGIEGSVDQNVFKGSYDQLKAFAK